MILEEQYGRDLTGKLTDEEWDALDWQPPTVRIDTNPWQQFNTLCRSASSCCHPIRNVRLERRVIPDPDDGWTIHSRSLE